MCKYLLFAIFGGCITACTMSQQNTAVAAFTVVGALDPQVAAAGQLFCATANGVYAVANANVTNKTAAAVLNVCHTIDPNAVPTPAPAVASVAVVAVPAS
jgi:hypothetical protein